jgi:hypothetical protein
VSHASGHFVSGIARRLLRDCLFVFFGLPAIAFGQADRVGEWGATFDWPNVAVHAHLLPNGKVLFWSRREWADGKPTESLDPQDSTPRLWDPETNEFSVLPRPGYSLFCSSHTLLADGRLLVTGGHIRDGEGQKHATIYDLATNSWTRLEDMNDGRWYPTAITLGDGSALVFAGAGGPGQPANSIPQIWNGAKWRSLTQFSEPAPLYPMMHLAPDGKIFIAGPLRTSWVLDITGSGSWTKAADFAGMFRDFGSSVMYDKGKIVIIGGGNPPQNTAETIDLNQANPIWHATESMSFARRQHNATILADGQILVTGGTNGEGFNNLSMPVTTPELWNPVDGRWTQMAAEAIPRMYHSIAVLLPDARVLSAGGGEYRPGGGDENKPEDSRRDGQIFSPPYLFRGPRPQINNAPTVVSYGQVFAIETTDSSQIAEVNLIRLSSVTHAFNQNQRIIRNLPFNSTDGTKMQVTAPDDRNVCPPGHYMLFILNKVRVPSVARIMRIQ